MLSSSPTAEARLSTYQRHVERSGNWGGGLRQGANAGNGCGRGKICIKIRNQLQVYIEINSKYISKTVSTVIF